ncbi:unnamed protein product [Onchocerca flexuosa]|uniref:Uncharacterized protein n=1 Tax=Onchocerca flexuosa TaxID=387005 RepID=A0A183HHE4_9BILA|nr:unnamed protein product [Onchocerca flexuosa]
MTFQTFQGDIVSCFLTPIDGQQKVLHLAPDKKKIENLPECTAGFVSIKKDIADVEGTDADNAFLVSASRLTNSISDRSECDLNFVFHSIFNVALPFIYSTATVL